MRKKPGFRVIKKAPRPIFRHYPDRPPELIENNKKSPRDRAGQK